MNTTLFEKLTALLERFLIAFIVWFNTTLTEKKKIILKSLQTRLKANSIKEEVEDATKKLSDEELASRTVID